MANTSTVLSVYSKHMDAEAAIKDLQYAGVDLKSLSIVGKDSQTEEHALLRNSAGHRMKYWGKLGAFWGGLWGLLFGSSFFLIPGIGSLMAAGPFVQAIVGGLEGAAVIGGMSALGAGFYSFCVPKSGIPQYQIDLAVDHFVLVVEGSDQEVARATGILNASNTGHSEIYSMV